jgi:oligopeptide transport system substrate-binding protein
MVKNERILRKYKVSGKLRRTFGVIKPPYNGAKEKEGCSEFPCNSRRDEKGVSMRTEDLGIKGPRRVPGMSRKDFLKLGGAGLAGATLLGTAGCGVFSGSGGGGGGGGGSSKSVAINLEQTVKDLDSAQTTDSVSTEILQNVMSGLYRLDPNSRPFPDMAEGVDISEDGLNYTFTLRDGIKWSNGDPVTSQDFKYAWLRALDPKTASLYAYIISTFVKGADEYNTGKGSPDDVAIETPDDKTLEVTLLSPAPYWLGLTSFFTYLPQQQKFVEQQGDKYASGTENLLYNGPYKITQFNPTSGVTVVKNEDYWNADNVDISKVEAKIVKDTDTAVNLFESGQLDETVIDTEFVTEYKGKPELVTVTQFATGYLTFNRKVPLFRNENVRRAIQMGFDRAALNYKILNNGSEPATGFVPDGIAGPDDQTFREAEGPTVPAYDPQKAKELFKKGIEEVGENPTIELLSEDDSLTRDFVTFMQSEFEKMGMKIDLKPQPFAQRLKLEEDDKYQMSAQAWIADYDDPMTFLDLFESSSTYNTSIAGHYKNERYDQLINDAKNETNAAKRMDMLLEAEKLLVEEDAALAPWRFYGSAYLVDPTTISRFVDQPYGGGKDYSLWKLS